MASLLVDGYNDVPSNVPDIAAFWFTMLCAYTPVAIVMLPICQRLCTVLEKRMKKSLFSFVGDKFAPDSTPGFPYLVHP